MLEIGFGTGLNLPFYDAARVSGIVGIGAERLPLADHIFDTVVSTYTLCTIPDPVAELREVRRVLAPGGRLLFSEHGRAPDENVRKWQTRLQSFWSPLAGGCRLDRDIPAILKEAGFDPQRSRCTSPA